MGRTREHPSRVPLVLLIGLLLFPAAASAQAIWRLEQPPPPPGARFKVPLGPPGDLQFLSRNRGLLLIEGNSTIPRGIYSWDGAGWHQLSTVCGGPGDTARVTFAAPTEFWTVSEPSRPRLGSGTALCRFKDGQVVASYSTPDQSPDPYRQMASATCNGPDDCWFGGFGEQDPTGERVGAFHLHWDGRELQTVYAPQGRGVSDVEAHAGTVFESVVVGRRPEDRRRPVELAEPETPKPRLIHRITARGFVNDPFTVADRAGVPPDGTELLGLDSDGQQLWAVGGGAASGPSAPEGGVVARPPIAARLEGDAFRELRFDASGFGPTERFVDVAAIPGTASAWVASQPFADRRSVTAKAKVAQIGAEGSVSITTLPTSGSGRGSAARIAFTAPGDGWMVTYGGWLFHYTDGSAVPRDEDPAFQGTITSRPNEAAEQFVPDAPPPDDSQLFAPPPLEIEQAPPPARPGRRLSPLLRRVKSTVEGRTLTVRFTLVRSARIALVARRRGRIVARTKARLLRPGKRVLRLRLDLRRYPTSLRFSARERGRRGGGGSEDTVTTGGDPDAVATASRRAPFDPAGR